MNFIEPLGVSVTPPDADPHQIEWLFFEDNSPMHKDIQTKNHIAFQVDDLDAAVKGYNVICQPFSAGPGVRLAFIENDGAVIELMESKPVPACHCNCGG
ncbi:MAG: hypothetical protein FWE67_12565 [Planctomycetaceae bacterium]|nr:hypothetical protein [Planctomycetaceae bacterium]